MVLASYEVPVAYSMVAMADQLLERSYDSIQRFMCYWVAFNSIYVTIAEQNGERAQLKRNQDGSIRTRGNGQVSVPVVAKVSERKQLDIAFKTFPEDLKRGLLRHPSTRYFVHRKPSWRGKRIEHDGRGQQLNGVLNVSYTVDARYPVWAPIDAVEYEAYHLGGETPERLELLARQILDVLYTVRNNAFHGGKRADDANDNEVVAQALPLLYMIISSFIEGKSAA